MADPAGLEECAPADTPVQEPAPELGLLKKLLFRPEQAKIDALQSQCEAFAEKIGDEARFEQATAQVLAGALRKAEIAQHRDLSVAIAPLVVAAIRSEIVNSRDMMVEALYPITGRLVAASVAGAFRQLADSLQKRIDMLLSTQMWRLRLRAWLTGRPLSEILLEAAQRPRLLRLLALERDSGRLLAHWRDADTGQDPPDDDSRELVSGLIAAISQFAEQAFAREQGELRQLDMGASRLLLRASPRTLIAAEFSGAPDAADEKRVDRALDALIESGPDRLDGDALARMAQGFAPDASRKPSELSRVVLICGLAAALGALAYVPVRDFSRAWRIESAFTAAQDAQNLGAWPLKLSIDRAKGKVTVAGLAPAQADLDAFAASLAPAAAPYGFDLRVARVAGAESAAQNAARIEQAARATQALSAQAGGKIAALEAELAALQQWRAARDVVTPQARLARLARGLIQFDQHVDLLEPDAARATIAALAEALKASGGALRIVGYSDSSGAAARNLAISRARAQAVMTMLIEAGADPAKLVIVGRSDEAAVADDETGGFKRNRRVTFEPLDPGAEP